MTKGGLGTELHEQAISYMAHLAKEEPAKSLSAADAQRALLVKLIERALRSEGGLRFNQSKKEPTGYYAGRRTGFVASAATLCNMLYGVDEEAAKATINKAVREAGSGMTSAMPNNERNQRMAIEIAAKALLAQ